MRVLIPVAIMSLVIVHHRCAAISDASALMRKVVPKDENIMEILFTEWGRVMLKFVSQAVFIGGSSDQLLMVKPMMEKHPYFVGTNLQSIMATKSQFVQNALVLMFPKSMDDKYVNGIAEDIWNSTSLHSYIIYEGNATKNEINAILSASVGIGENIPRPYHRIFIHHYGGVVKFYKREFSVNCSLKPVMVLNYSKKRSLKTIKRFFTESPNYKGCPGTVITRHIPPRMILSKQPNGEFKITGGYEGNMVMELANVLNFSPKILVPDYCNGQVQTNETQIGKQISSLSLVMIVDGIRNSLRLNEEFEFSFPYGRQCAIWCVPRIRKWRYIIVLGEFSNGAWALIAMIFALLTVVFGSIRIQNSTERGAMGKTAHFCSALFYIYSLSLGNSLPRQSISVDFKKFLLMCLLYSLIMNTAYKSSLASILFSDIERTTIVDAEEILKAGLSVGGDSEGLQLLHEQSEDNATIRELVKRYIVYNDTLAALRRLIIDKDFALLILGRDLNYYANQFSELYNTPLTFNVIKSCVLSYNTAIALPKASGSAAAFSRSIRYFAQSGFLNYWWYEKYFRHESKIENNVTTTQQKGRDYYYETLIFCALLLSASIFVFFGELIYHKFQMRGKSVKSLTK